MLPRHRRFVQEYLKDGNATRAYKAAGYSAQGNVAEAAASRLLRHVKVREAVEKAIGKQIKQYEISADKILQESARLAFVDIRQLYEDDGTLKPVSAWPDEVAAAVAGIETVQDAGTVRQKIHLWSKPSQLTLLAKHLRLLQDNNAPPTVVTVTIAVQSLTGALTRAYPDSAPAGAPQLPG